MLLVNERETPYRLDITMAELASELKPEADLFIVNGHPVESSTVLVDGDSCWLIQRGEIPEQDEIERLLHARHTPGVHGVLKKSVVGIMGLGGLGSVVAVALARMGIGRLLIADFDVVEPSNLNRQQYFIDQIGLKKTEALKTNLARVNPYVKVDIIDTRLSGPDIVALFDRVDVLVECFDDAEMKALAMRTVLQSLPGKSYVAASGMAGCQPNNSIRTRRLYPGVYMVGDEETEARPGEGLMAARVGIAAHQQANQVVRLLLGLEDGEKVV